MPSKLIDRVTDQIKQTDEELLVAIGKDAEEAIDFESDQIDGIERLNYLASAREVGQKVLNRVNRELHAIVCGDDDDDEEDREAILKAVGLDDIALCATMASVAVAALGCSPLAATACSVIIMRLVIRPGRENLCASWKDSLTS